MYKMLTVAVKYLQPYLCEKLHVVYKPTQAGMNPDDFGKHRLQFVSFHWMRE